MSLSVLTEPQQGATYAQLSRFARHAEQCGFEGFFRSDHYLRYGDGDRGAGPTDAWITLAGLALETSHIRLGTLVSAATFRSPGQLAITVAQVDAMSNGRLELGLGAGWMESEHRAFAIPFPPRRERFDRWEEQLTILTGLWATPADEVYNFAGNFYTMVDTPPLPRPVQRPGPPLIVGGKGARRTPDLAARFATEYNIAFSSVDQAVPHYDLARAACERVGREAAGRPPLRLSLAHRICCARSDVELARRAAAFGCGPDELRQKGICGTPEEVAKKIVEYRAIGVQRFYLQMLDLDDLDHVELIAAEVMPLLD